MATDSQDGLCRLFLSLTEQLKSPLQYIARSAELGLLYDAGQTERLHDIQDSADLTLQLLDGYLLSLRLGLKSLDNLRLEPVSVPDVLHEAAAELDRTATAYGVELQLHAAGHHCGPVLADRQALLSAMVALGYAVIEALPASGGSGRHIRLAVHRGRQGIVAGVYGQLDGLTPGALQRARRMQGTVRQPLPGSMPGSGTGVFMADALLSAMKTRLRVGRYLKLPGFAVTLPPLEQLQLV